jgi:two-component system LytT family response regulator
LTNGLVSVDRIEWIQAADNHLKLHAGEGCHLVRGRLRELKKQLAPEQFLQIHRSTIVNLDHLQEIRTFGNRRRAIMADGTHLDVGGNYFQRLRELWKPTF